MVSVTCTVLTRDAYNTGSASCIESTGACRYGIGRYVVKSENNFKIFIIITIIIQYVPHILVQCPLNFASLS